MDLGTLMVYPSLRVSDFTTTNLSISSSFRSGRCGCLLTLCPGPAQLHGQVQEEVLEVPAVVRGPGDVMGDFLQGDFYQPIRQASRPATTDPEPARSALRKTSPSR